MYKYLKLVVQSFSEIGNCYFKLKDKRTAGYREQPLEVSNDQLILDDGKSYSSQRHVDNVTKEGHNTPDNQNNTVFSVSKTDKSRKHMTFAYRQKKKTDNAFNKTIEYKEFQRQKVKYDKSQPLREIRTKYDRKVSNEELIPSYGQKKETDTTIKKNLSSNFCTNCPSQQVRNMKRGSPKPSRLQNSHSFCLFTKMPFSQCYILFGLCCEVSGNSNPKMYLSVNHTQAIFNEPFSLLCHITNATECTHLSFLQGTYENNDIQWKVLARGDIPYTQQFVPSLNHSKNGITYNLTIPQLQPDDVGAWFRCECDGHNNVSKRLIQIDDRLTVNPEIFTSRFKILNMMINFTIDIWNVYPDPKNCTLTILSDKHSQVVSYNRTHCTTTTVPYLLNATYSGFSNTPFKLCNPNVTVICHFGDRFISKHYTPAVCDELEKKSEEMTSWNSISIAIIVCAFFLIVFSFIPICARCIWTKRRKHIHEKKEVVYLDNCEYHDIKIHPCDTV